MSSRHRKGWRASRYAPAVIGAALALGMAAARPAEAAVIVLRAQGPAVQASFKPGAPVRAGQRIELGDYEELWLLDNSGSRILRGPGRWVLAEGGASAGGTIRLTSLVQVLNDIDDGTLLRRAIPAAVRGARPSDGAPPGSQAPPPEPGPADLARLLEVANIYEEGRYCVWGDRIRFVQGRGGAGDNAPATLATRAGRLTIRFTDGVSEEIAVDRLAAGSGDVTIRADGARHPARFTRIAPPATLEALAAAAAEAGCDTTLLGLGRYFRAPE
jgi:hypothetical protein